MGARRCRHPPARASYGPPFRAGTTPRRWRLPTSLNIRSGGRPKRWRGCSGASLARWFATRPSQYHSIATVSPLSRPGTRIHYPGAPTYPGRACCCPCRRRHHRLPRLLVRDCRSRRVGLRHRPGRRAGRVVAHRAARRIGRRLAGESEYPDADHRNLAQHLRRWSQSAGGGARLKPHSGARIAQAFSTTLMIAVRPSSTAARPSCRADISSAGSSTFRP